MQPHESEALLTFYLPLIAISIRFKKLLAKFNVIINDLSCHVHSKSQIERLTGMCYYVLRVS